MERLEKQKRIRGILFDKDGTLIDFNSIWVPLAFDLVNHLLVNCPDGQENECKRLLLQKIGVAPNGTIRPDSIYASGTEQEIADALYDAATELNLFPVDYSVFLSAIRERIRTYMSTHRQLIHPVLHAERTLASLKKKGFTLGISTSDSEENTLICMEETGLIQYFDYIGCPGSRKSPKPSGDILWDFSQKFGIEPEEVAVVGDTPVDIAFARQNHAGLAIGVLSGAGKSEELSENADYVLPAITEILQNGEPIWLHNEQSS